MKKSVGKTPQDKTLKAVNESALFWGQFSAQSFVELSPIL